MADIPEVASREPHAAEVVSALPHELLCFVVYVVSVFVVKRICYGFLPSSSAGIKRAAYRLEVEHSFFCCVTPAFTCVDKSDVDEHERRKGNERLLS